MNTPQQIKQIPLPPDRPADAHKGTFGTVIVIGGSPTMPGAPAIAARAAFRCGCGLVKIATNEKTLSTSLSIEPGATGIILGGDTDAMLSALDSADPDHKAVMAVGPGLGQSEKYLPFIQALLTGKRTVVLDADGLNLLAAANLRHTSAGAPLVMTPHPGEFTRLAEAAQIHFDSSAADQRETAAGALAQFHQATVVLKGRHTVIADTQRLFINDTGNPALATAGSGDVLTGAIAALIAQGMDTFSAAVLAVHAHGLAADQWAKQNGLAGLLARELADNMGQVLWPVTATQ